MILTVELVLNEGSPAIDRIRDAVQNDRIGINRMVAARMLIPVQATLRQMALTNHNKFGARSTFWNLMFSGTYAKADDDFAIVGTPAPVALRYFGGTVAPTEKELLAIPNRPEAYNKSPKDFPDLDLIPFKRADGSPILALVQRQSQFIKILKSGRVRRGRVVGFATVADAKENATEDDVFYWLVPTATIAGNPDVLPDDEAILEAARGGCDSYFMCLARGEGGSL